MKISRIRNMLAIGCALTTTGCLDACVPSYCDDPSVIIEPRGVAPGPYSVGVVEEVLVSTVRRETLFGEEDVELKASAWYPATSIDGASPFCYDDIAPGHGYAKPQAACESPRPVAIYSHGSGGVRWLSSYLTEHLASQGYVVAAPDHRFNTFLDNDNSDAAFDHVVLRRPVDVQDTFAWLVRASEDPANVLYGCVDENAGYAVIGHSYGGYTALAVGGWELTPPRGASTSRQDPRVWAVATQAPWHADGTLGLKHEAIDVPLMTLAAERDDTTLWTDVSSLHASVSTVPSYLGLMPNAGHYSFVPASCEVVEDGDGCGDDFLPGDEAAGLITRATWLFLEEARGMGASSPTALESEELRWDPPLP
ncbi:MAG: alpha/beta hydrolase family protein [Myxococcota bacterium]